MPFGRASVSARNSARNSNARKPNAPGARRTQRVPTQRTPTQRVPTHHETNNSHEEKYNSIMSTVS